MRFANGVALVLLLVLGECMSIGCSDKSTEPEPPPPAIGMKHLWSKRFGDESFQGTSAVAFDASGHVIVAGGYIGTVDFGGGPLTCAKPAIFVAKLAPDGAHIWSKCFHDDNNLQAPWSSAVAVDAMGNVVVTGTFYGAIDFGGGSLACAGTGDVFVAKLGSDGTHIWSHKFGDDMYQVASSVVFDASGNVIVAGEFYGTIDLGGGVLTCAGGLDVFVAKLGSDGTHVWSNAFGDGADQCLGAIATDVSSNVVVTGDFDGTIDFGGGVLTSAGNRDIFIAKFESDGAHLWSRRFGDGASQFPWDVAIDASGNIIVNGNFDGTVDFGGGALTSAGDRDLFVAKLTPNANHIWSAAFYWVATYYATISQVSVDAEGSAVLAGSFVGEVDFGGGPLVCAGYVDDIFVAKFGQ